MAIKITVDPSRQLTIFTGTGKLTFDEITHSLTSFYNTNPTLNVLFDLSQASVGAISSSQVDQIVELVKELRMIRKGGRSAVVAATDLTFGLVRMAQAIAANSDQDPVVETGVFRDIKAASDWLDRDRWSGS